MNDEFIQGHADPSPDSRRAVLVVKHPAKEFSEVSERTSIVPELRLPLALSHSVDSLSSHSCALSYRNCGRKHDNRVVTPSFENEIYTVRRNRPLSLSLSLPFRARQRVRGVVRQTEADAACPGRTQIRGYALRETSGPSSLTIAVESTVGGNSQRRLSMLSTIRQQRAASPLRSLFSWRLPRHPGVGRAGVRVPWLEAASSSGCWKESPETGRRVLAPTHVSPSSSRLQRT